MPSVSDNLLSFDNPVFSAYAFYSALLVLKMLAMSLLTAKQRFAKKVSRLSVSFTNFFLLIEILPLNCYSCVVFYL